MIWSYVDVEVMAVLQTLEQDWEITYDDGSDMGEEISHIRVNEVKQQYTLE